jgi:hypothetical protein
MAEPRTSQHIWKGSIIPLMLDISARLYTVKEGAVLLLYNQISEKDQRIQFKKAAASSQPKSLVDNNVSLVVVMVIQNK